MCGENKLDYLYIGFPFFPISYKLKVINIKRQHERIIHPNLNLLFNKNLTDMVTVAPTVR